MRNSDLYREWADLIDLCDGTDILPANCWKYNGELMKINLPTGMEAIRHTFDFAIAIVENKPVFVGDVLCIGGKLLPVICADHLDKTILRFDAGNGYISSSTIEHITWTKPDEYAHLRKALADGKRVAFNREVGGWCEWIGPINKNYAVECYKIVEDDDLDNRMVVVFGERVIVGFTKSGLTGEITTEIVK